jgi:hypothetical protein
MFMYSSRDFSGDFMQSVSATDSGYFFVDTGGLVTSVLARVPRRVGRRGRETRGLYENEGPIEDL